MKFSLAITALLANASAQETVDMKKMELITEGFLRGGLHAEGFDDITKCITDAEGVLKDAEGAYQDFATKKLTKIADGFTKLADMVTKIQVGMQDCSTTPADWKKMEAFAKTFKSPTSFAWHVAKDLIFNGVDIFHEIMKAIDEYKAGNWNQFGFASGEAAAKVLFGAESQANLKAASAEKGAKKEALATAMQGFLAEFGGDFDLWALLVCISEEDKAALILNESVKEFEAAVKTWKTDHKTAETDAFTGAVLGYAAYGQFKKGLPACENVYTKI